MLEGAGSLAYNKALAALAAVVEAVAKCLVIYKRLWSAAHLH